MIDVQNLTKYYGRVCAVRGISFHVREGEIVGFLGPNGAGKTTTLRVLTCYHPATSGTAKVAGHDVFRESLQVRQNIGYLPESVPLYLEMRVIEYLKFRAKLRGIPPARRQAAIDRVAELCWIRDVIRRPIGQLSKGYRQRVALADALLHDPPVLILDEPTVGLDPAQIRETRSLIRSLAPAHTILFSSHILPEVEAICDRILIIHQGRLIASGTAEELRSRAADGVCVVAEVRAPEKTLIERVQKLDGIQRVEAASRDGWVHLRAVARGDVRDRLAGLCGENGWALRELRRELPTLEDFFVKVVLEARKQSA